MQPFERFFVVSMIIVLAVTALRLYRDRVRQSSLRRRDDGLYVWVEWPWGERTSLSDPERRDGEWNSLQCFETRRRKERSDGGSGNDSDGCGGD